MNINFLKILFTFFTITVLFSSAVFAQKLSGHISNDSGEDLPFASIYVREISYGTSSNENGDYSIELKPGLYTIDFQFLGYASQTKTVSVSNQSLRLNITMESQSLTLRTVTVSSKDEDPSYTVMRRAIAKSKFHLLQLDQYSAQVYIKGTGKLDKIPWLLRSRLEKEGVDTGKVVTTESISEIYYERPNTFKEKVISVRTSVPTDTMVSPNSYINGSFYQPEIAECISPLSPRAFAYYKFYYQGSYFENGYKIHKVMVIPRSKGSNVFEGTIYIRDKFWNIHSLDLSTTVEGFDIHIVQLYTPVKDDIWMPVKLNTDVGGSVFGFEGKFHYTAVISNYNIIPNSELTPDIEVIDEKIEEVPEAVKEKNIKEEPAADLLKEKDQQLTRKQLNKLIREYEKAEEEKEEEPDVVSNYNFEIDTNAMKSDSIYWAKMRPVPLTQQEVKGYEIADSTFKATHSDSIDTTTVGRITSGKLSLGDFIFGDTYKIGKHASIDYKGFLRELRYNTVEGVNLDFESAYRWKNDSDFTYRLQPNIRYGFSSETFYGKLLSEATIGKTGFQKNVHLEGGKYIHQFLENSIHPFVNSLYTLLLARNYMKLYEKEYVKLSYYHEWNYKLNINGSVEYANRNALYNTTDFTLMNPWAEDLLPNNPENVELPLVAFNNAKAFKTSLSLATKPWLKFRTHNGKKIPIQNSSPELSIKWNAGWDGIFESTTNFQQLELGFKAEYQLGVRANIDFDATVGSFLSNENLEFVDFKHFQGGRTEFAPLNVTGNFRLLEYYNYSTADNYFTNFTHIKFRKLLLTQLPLVRISGIKENLFVNYLATGHSPQYAEVGYTIDQIFRLFRLELVHSFEDFSPKEFGVRIGISANIIN